MKMFLSQKKYSIIAIVAIVATLYVVFSVVVPATKLDAETFFMARSEIKMSETMQNTSSPDSLIAEYESVSRRIQKYTNVRITSSTVLTFVHEMANKSGFALNDLSTGEMLVSGNEVEIPVTFRANAPFVDVLKFLKELENGGFCIRADDVNMNGSENGFVSTSVRFSVLSRNANDSTKTVNAPQKKSSMGLKDMLALLRPQEISVEKLRNPFSLPKQFMPKSKVAPAKPKEQAPPKEHPAITLDAILPGNNPVAILKFNGESAVVSVGQKIWGVAVIAIKNDRVILKDEIGKFEVRN